MPTKTRQRRIMAASKKGAAEISKKQFSAEARKTTETRKRAPKGRLAALTAFVPVAADATPDNLTDEGESMKYESRRRSSKSGMAKRAYLAIFFLLSCTLVVSGQTGQPSPTPIPDLNQVKDFRPLFDERERLIDQLTQLDQAIDELSAKVRNLPPVDTLQRDLARLNREMEKERKAATPDAQKVESLQRYIDQTNDNLETAKNSAPLKDKILERDQQRRRLMNVEQRIASLFDATRDINFFRSIATISFSVLVLIVVGGFYLIAWFKNGVASKIFAGEMGMQFVTLFLIVIAIILFGIMGTLEGRELAALLGGLSGYILGKAGFKRDETPPPNPNATANSGQKLNPEPNSDSGR